MPSLLALLSLCAGMTAGLAIGHYADGRFERRVALESTSDPAKLPQTEAALVIGTSYVGANGLPNPLFEYRLDAAAELWKAGKVKYLIASGNLATNYNEPHAMQTGLIARGVPADAISRDYAGLHIRDSVLRARDIYRQYRILIVAQSDTVGRALYVADHSGMEARGYNVRGVDRPDDIESAFRRYLSALYAYVDFWLRTKPRETRPPILLGRDAPT